MAKTDAIEPVGQPQFDRGINEGIQYEIFCGNRFFSVRVVETASLKYHCAWVFDGAVRELVSSFKPLARTGSAHLNLEGESLKIEADATGGRIAVRSHAGNLDIEFTSPITAAWTIPPADTAIHQPLLRVKVRWQGEVLEGYGYCKRYWYGHDIDYWNWRFVMGPVWQRNAPLWVWTAEASFALEKYDYFKIATPDGVIAAAGPKDSRHRESEAFGLVNGVECVARVRELGRWEKVLRTDAMDTKLRLKFCELTLTRGGETLTGHALHELGAGTSR